MEKKDIEKMLFAEYMAEHQKVEADALKFVFDARLKLLNEMHDKEARTIEQSFEHIIKVANDQIQLHEQQMKHDMDMAKLHHPPRPRPRPPPQTPIPASSQTRPPQPTAASSRSKPKSPTENGSAGKKAPEPDTVAAAAKNARHSRRRQAKEQVMKDAVPVKVGNADAEDFAAENGSEVEAEEKAEAKAEADDDADDDVEAVEVVRARPTRATRSRRKPAKAKVSLVLVDSASELSPTPVLRRRTRARTKR